MFTIVIPTYNRDNDLENCFKSIKENTTLPYEIIVLHNNQKSTIDLCEKHNVTHTYDNARTNGKRIKSLWAILNDGIKMAKYDLVMYLNDDCLVLPEWDSIAENYFKDDNTGLLVLKSKGIGGSQEFKVINSLFGFPCANYAIVNRTAGILFDESFDWFWGDADLPLQFAYKSKFKVKQTTENMIIHNHLIDETRKENEKDQMTDPDYLYFCDKWKGYKKTKNKIVKKNVLDYSILLMKKIIKAILPKKIIYCIKNKRVNK